MQKKTIIIPEGVSDHIQALQYECESRKDLLNFMLANGHDINGDGFKAYHAEYQAFHVKYNTAKEEMQKQFLEPQVDGRLIGWNLNFATREVTCQYEIH